MCAKSEMERLSLEELRSLQFKRLKKTLIWAYEKSRFYQKKFRAAGITPSALETLADIRKFPLTSYKELQETPASDLLTLPFSGLTRISLWEHPQPLIRMYTSNDIAGNAELMTRALTAAGMNRASVVGILGDMADSGLMDAQYALEFIGATIVPLSTEYDRAVALINAAHPDTLFGSVRRVLRFAIQGQAVGNDIAASAIRRVLCLNESIHNPLRNHIEKRTNAQVRDLFSSAEFGCIGMVFQCESCSGYHVQEDHFYPEIVSFGSNEVIADSSRMGELVVTTLTAEAIPIIRGHTGQTVIGIDTPCSCGRLWMDINTPLGFSN